MTEDLIGKHYIDPKDSGNEVMQVIAIDTLQPEVCVIVKPVYYDRQWQRNAEEVRKLLQIVQEDVSKRETFGWDDRAINKHMVREYLCNGYRYQLDQTLDACPPSFCLWRLPEQPGLGDLLYVNDEQYWGGGISWEKAEPLAFRAIYRDAFLEGKSYENLERLCQQGQARMMIEHINHREIVWQGTRYFCGWSSERTCLSPGWIVYNAKREDSVNINGETNA